MSELRELHEIAHRCAVVADLYREGKTDDALKLAIVDIRALLLPEEREPVGWRAFYIDARGREVWCGRAFVSETDGLEWCDRFKDLRPTLVPLYARPPVATELYEITIHVCPTCGNRVLRRFGATHRDAEEEVERAADVIDAHRRRDR